MEEILNKILSRLDSIDGRLNSMDQRFDSMDERFDSMDQRLSGVEDGQQSLQTVQGEMRLEVAFYYGSMMKKMDETKSELTSELKQVSSVQKQHQNVLEILNEKQQ